MRRLLVTAALALTLVPAASAATLDDLRAAGYTVARASDCQAGTDAAGAPIWKTTWSVSGYGSTTHMSECDPNFQDAVDNWADPALNFERRWQHEHPEQLAAAQAIGGKCYSITRTAPATDSWRITALLVDLTVAGAELPTLAGSLPDKRAVDGSCSATVAVIPSGSGPSVVLPGAPVVVVGPVEPVATAAPQTVAQPVATSAAVSLSSWQALVEAQAQGLTADEAALAARSAGLNTLYGLDS